MTEILRNMSHIALRAHDTGLVHANALLLSVATHLGESRIIHPVPFGKVSLSHSERVANVDPANTETTKATLHV